LGNFGRKEARIVQTVCLNLTIVQMRPHGTWLAKVC
jgi:hypothetical protein